MKILYGVVGEGMGHAMRSRVVLEHLIAAGHEIEVMVSGRAKDFLQKRLGGSEGSEIHGIHGFHLIYEDNRVRLGKTVWSNVLTGAKGVPENIAAYFELIRSFRPDVVISDFESWTYLYGQLHRLPVLSIDNMQVINRCSHEPDILEGHENQFRLTKTFIKTKLPFCEAYFVTTFFYPPVRKAKTTLFPPILRPEILTANKRKGEHLLVYQTAEGNTRLLDALQSSGLECRVYGMRRDLKEDVVEGNLRFRPFSESGFVDDLASCRALVAGGGFTAMGEAVYLQKPMLAIPLEGQFEQIINARYLTKLNYGAYAPAVDSDALRSFVSNLGRYEDTLASYKQNGNTLLFDAVDDFLAKAASGLL